MRRAYIHEYSYRPLTRYRRTPADERSFVRRYYLGVELETSREHKALLPAHREYRFENGDYHFAAVPAREVTESSPVRPMVAAALARPRGLWYPKHDASVSGPEFVSHPATMAYWRKATVPLGTMFHELIHAGYRSYDIAGCGMHVNVSKAAFAGSEHMGRFLALLLADKEWTLDMSQRDRESADHWASLDLLAEYAEDIQLEYRSDSFGTDRRNRYVALNVPSYSNRVEFRLPRGTLRLDRFMKNLEWTASMIEFTRPINRQGGDLTPIGYSKWLSFHSDMYPNVLRFVTEKGLNKFPYALGGIA